MENRQLLTLLQTLLGRLKRGDREAVLTVRRLKAGAKAGERAAELSFNTLAALYWERNSPTWKRAEAFYEKLLKKDPKAWGRAKVIRQRVSNQDEIARKGLAMLKAIHNHRKRSVWYPGAPQIGYYPMPTQHRPGIDTGGSQIVIGNWSSGFDSPIDDFLVGFYAGAENTGPPPIPPELANLLRGIPGMLPQVPAPSPIPGLPGWPQVPGLPPIPGLLGYPPPLPPGIPPAFIPLSQQGVTGLLQLISQARQSVPVGGRRDPMMMMSSLAPDDGGSTFSPPESTSESTVMSTVPRPSGMTTASKLQGKYKGKGPAKPTAKQLLFAARMTAARKLASRKGPSGPVATSSADLYKALQAASRSMVRAR